MNDLVPTFDQIYRIAPLTTIILLIVGIGYFVGRKSQADNIDTLKKWIKKLSR